MPELTRRRSTDAREECWHVHYGDVLAGTIAIGNGNPHDEDPWEWHCGFYLGCHPGEPRPASRRPAPISKKHGRFFWRNEPRLTFRRGVTSKIGPLENMRCASRVASGRKTAIAETKYVMKCICGQQFDSHRIEDTIIHVPHITARGGYEIRH
jgi:hypothetical protein